MSGITKNSRTNSISKISPIQIVAPAWPMFTTSLDMSANIVKAKAKAAVITTLPELPIVRIRGIT